MAATPNPLAGLPLDQLPLYHAVDSVLASVFVFLGPVATANSSLSSSRIQVVIFSPAGVQSYSRLAISPAAPIYASVNFLPRDKQGDETCRGLAVSLFKYFAELPESLTSKLISASKSGKQASGFSRSFDEAHAAELASKMAKVENSTPVIRDLKDAFSDRVVPFTDIDVILPPGSIGDPSSFRDSARGSLPRFSIESSSNSPAAGRFSERFGKYAPLIDSLGDPVFLPTSKLRRVPSQPSNSSKSKTFTATQKEALRLSMCEVVDTEERFVQKMYDLVHNIAQEFYQKANDKPPSSSSPDESKIRQLFPPCLNKILEVNVGFLDAVRHVLEQTDAGSLEDLSKDTTMDASVFPRDLDTGKRTDPLGAIAFAQCLVDWFPRFSGPYGQYMHAHTGFNTILHSFLGDQNSSFSKRVYETGEQRMRSLLMEPVQRLPRYNLLIDTMTSSLPLKHPAVRLLLKARDIITGICSLDSFLTTDHCQVLKRLRDMVSGLPTSVAPEGRLITAADMFILRPPFRTGSNGSRELPGILLLFSDSLVLLTRQYDSKWTARGLCADLDTPVPPSPEKGSPDCLSSKLRYSQSFSTACINCAQSKCGRILYLIPLDNPIQEQSRVKGVNDTVFALELGSAYETRATKLIEEITKARIEARFPEHYRGNENWSLHAPRSSTGGLSTLLCVFEQDSEESNGPKFVPTVKLRIDCAKPALKNQEKSSSTELMGSLSSLSGGSRYRMDIGSLSDSASTYTFPAHDFVPNLCKRLHTLLHLVTQPRNPPTAGSILNSNFSILRVVAEHVVGTVRVSKPFRPPSPTKLFSSFLVGGQSKSTNNTPKKALDDIPNLQHQTCVPSLKNTNASNGGGISIADEAAGRFQQLEETFTAYILSMRSRSGNIVGRVLRTRERADPVVVNGLCNNLLEDSTKLQFAAEAPVDVLIVAFESFLANVWRDTMGPIVSESSLRLMQTKFDTLFPGDFEDFFHGHLSEMSPQSRRALTALIKLLAELLSASGNDGDKGALTELFACIVTGDNNSRKFIPLLDRLVEDFGRLFGDSIPAPPPHDGVLQSSIQNQSFNASSVSSNTSSFRKRFGFGLSRGNSKNEGEGKVSSIIRSLSKSKNNQEVDSPYSSLSKGSLMRSRSTETDSRLYNFLRPRSRDRPLMQSLFTLEDESHRPTSAHSNAPSLGSTGERSAHPKKKRRSSLSDLKPLSAVGVPPLFAKSDFRNPLSPITTSSSHVSQQVTPTKPSTSIYSPQRSPIRDAPAGQISSPVRQSRKENIPPTPKSTSSGDRGTNRKANTATGSPQLTRKGDIRRASPKGSNVREKTSIPGSGADTRGPRMQTTSTKTPQKLRMQSPQKLRERVQNERKSLVQAESALRAELASISEEFSGKPPKGRPVSSGGPNSKPSNSPSTTTSSSMSQRIRVLDSKVSTMVSNLGARAKSLENDLENSLLVSEKRAKNMDELYRDASAENQALYERFNSELSKMSKDIRVGTGEEAIKRQLKEALDEVAKVKKENLRLKREISQLRAQ